MTDFFNICSGVKESLSDDSKDRFWPIAEVRQNISALASCVKLYCFVSNFIVLCPTLLFVHNQARHAGRGRWCAGFPRLESVLLEQRLCCVEITCGRLVSPDAILQYAGPGPVCSFITRVSRVRCNLARRFASSSAIALGLSSLFVVITPTYRYIVETLTLPRHAQQLLHPSCRGVFSCPLLPYFPRIRHGMQPHVNLNDG